MFARSLFLAFISSSLLGAACGGGGSGSGSVDKVDRAALTDGKSETRTLKFWMKGSGGKGDEIVPNVHFDDGANTRIVFWFGEAMAAKVDTLEQGKTYKVTFDYKTGDDLVFGTMTGVE